jgi:hypothetical protein
MRFVDRATMPVVTLSDERFLAVSSKTGRQQMFPWPYGGGEATVPSFGEVILSTRWQEIPSFVAAVRRGDIEAREVTEAIPALAEELPAQLRLDNDYLNLVAKTMAHSAVWLPEYDAVILEEATADGRSAFNRQFVKTTWLTFLRQLLWREQHERPSAREDVVNRVQKRITAIEGM